VVGVGSPTVAVEDGAVEGTVAERVVAVAVFESLPHADAIIATAATVTINERIAPTDTFA
jgi:hypothetical protein